MIRSKYKKKKEELIKDIIKSETQTCILKIELKAASKITNHFIYEVCYLDQGSVKSIPVVAENVYDIIRIIKPYVNKGISEQRTSFEIGMTEEVLISRKK